ncbi:MAG: GNAT family N-acetyltransferase [Alphaproteobacteria bacterium]|nr:GNAT family N-acetyltransferase [Alphaproteobacteria bacterium]
MTWDNPELGTGLHVSHQGEGWAVRETRSDDIEFYRNLLGNHEVMKTMTSGKPVSMEDIPHRVTGWVAKFSDGNPTGRMVLEKNDEPVGFAHLAPCGGPGKSEIARALVPEAQGQGLGKAALGFIVNEWAPALRARGLGLDIDPSHPTVEKFKCFGGEPLKLIYTTARPSNTPSWKCYKYFDFHPSQPTDQTHLISCEIWEESQHGPLEDFIISKYYSETSPNRLEVNTLYPMVDETGTPRTLSFVEKYESLRYHFERTVE